MATATVVVSKKRPLAPCARRTIRVLHVVNGQHYAGAERVQDLLALRLPELGVEPSFACVKPDKFPQVRQSQATMLHSVPMYSRFDLRVAWRLAKLVRRERFDIIHTHTPRSALVGSLAARWTDVPLVHHVHGQTVTEVGAGWRSRISATTERFSLRGASAVIAVSPSAAQYIADWGVLRDCIHLVPNGVPPVPPAVRVSERETWTLGIVALFRPRKGLEVLLESLAILLDRNLPVHLRAIGGFETSEYEVAVRALTKRLNVDRAIDWRGFQRNVAGEIAPLDLLVLPSILAEGMPMVVLEGMAAGTPTVGSDVPGIRDVIDHGRDGLLFEPGNPRALADAIESIVLGLRDLDAIRRRARRSHAEKFSDAQMAARVADVYQSVLSSRTPPQ